MLVIIIYPLFEHALINLVVKAVGCRRGGNLATITPTTIHTCVSADASDCINLDISKYNISLIELVEMFHIIGKLFSLRLRRQKSYSRKKNYIVLIAGDFIHNLTRSVVISMNIKEKVL